MTLETILSNIENEKNTKINRNQFEHICHFDNKTEFINKLQECYDELVGNFGEDETITELQVYINGLRESNDVHNASEEVNEEFVQ
jgi:hypothetical protein